MKKLLSIFLLTGVFLLSFTACADEPTMAESTSHSHNHENESQSITTDTQSATDSATEGVTESSSHGSTQGSDQTATQAKNENAPSDNSSEKPAPPSQTGSKTIIRGSYSGNKYKNPVLNLSFTLTSGWDFYSDKELCSLSGLSLNTFSQFSNAAESNPAVYDMYAIHKESGSSVSICYENLLYTTGSTLSAREYLEVIKAAVAGAGVSKIEDYGTVSFCSGSFEKATITSGSSHNRQTHYIAAVDHYIATIIISSPNAEAEEEIIKMFK